MTDLPEVYELPFRVHWYDAGMLGNLTMVALLRQLQEAAEAHATALGVAFDYMNANDLVWVLSRYHVQLTRHATVGEPLTVRTWPAGFQRLFAIREFEVADGAGQIVARGSSAWLLLRQDNLRPVRVQDVLPAIPLRAVRAIDEPFQTLPKLESVPEASRHQDRFKVRMHDLDINRHVNNTVYVRCAFESVPPETWEQYRPIAVEANFLGMAWFGDTIRAETIDCTGGGLGEGEKCFLHALSSESHGTELTRVRSLWGQAEDMRWVRS